MSDIKDLKAALQLDLDRLVEVRDQLRVQLQLAKSEVSDEWTRLEATWQRVEEELKRVGDHTKEPVKELGTAARHLIDELKQGYERIRASLKA
jgi:predicted  nucleic acid-binding Zn-ribbon protein